MLDALLRPFINPPLDSAGRWLAARRISADHLTVAGFGIGLAGSAAIALGQFSLGLALISANRLADGLDGAVARATQQTDRGGFLDIALDFTFYASVPLAFALGDPASNALPAALLIASFLANGSAFLAYAIIASRRGMSTSTQGAKSIYYAAGLAEGAETIAIFAATCLWPAAFPWLASGFAALCLISAAGRILLGWRNFS